MCAYVCAHMHVCVSERDYFVIIVIIIMATIFKCLLYPRPWARGAFTPHDNYKKKKYNGAYFTETDTRRSSDLSKATDSKLWYQGLNPD